MRILLTFYLLENDRRSVETLFLSVNFTVLSFKKPLLINFIVINSKLHLFSIISKAIIYLFFNFSFFFTKRIIEEPTPFDLTDFSKAPEPTHPKYFSPPKHLHTPLSKLNNLSLIHATFSRYKYYQK